MEKENKNSLYWILGASAFFFVIFVVISIVMVVSFTGTGRSQGKIFSKSNQIGVVELNGVIMDSKRIVDQLEDFEEDKMIKGIVLRINSPGGAVAPSQEIYDSVRAISKTKPVYASMSSVAASGGYYVACGAQKVFANPGTMTGSIGVIMQFADLSKLYEWAKVSPYNIKTGKFKDIGSPNRQMSADEKELLQDMADNVLGQFRKAVSEGRNMSLQKVIEVSDGRIFSGEQAKKLNLVDELGGLNDAAIALAKEVGIKDKPKLVYNVKKRKFLEKLLMDLDDDQDAESSNGNVSILKGVFGKILIQTLNEFFHGAAPVTESLSNANPGIMFLLPMHSR